MSSKILIQNGTLYSSSGSEKKDILIEGGKILRVAENIDVKETQPDRIIDAVGLSVLPGLIDPQVHFREPGNTHKEDLHTGSMAAAAGGITGFFDMPNNSPSITTVELMADKKALAREKCVVNYNFFMGATPDNLEELQKVPNVNGIKVFMGSSTGTLLVEKEEDLDRIFKGANKLIAVHAEDNETIEENAEKYKDRTDFYTHALVRDEKAALKATQKAVRLAKKYNKRLHVLHLTTEEEVDFLREAKEGSLISTEVCPQHLLLSAPEAYEKLGSLAQMNPPIREKRHAKALWKGLKEGVIDCIATDHAPHTLEEKNQPYGKAPSGMPGVETSLPLMLNEVNKGNCSLNDIVKWMSENPVKLYRIKNKGKIAPGFDADLTIVDLNKIKTVKKENLYTKVKWSPFEGWELKGWPVYTIVMGQVVFENEKVNPDIRGTEIQIEEE